VENRETGSVKWFNDQKGYGFITRDEQRGDVFVHFSQVSGETNGQRKLKQGERVEFAVVETDRGAAAQSVVRSA
jgi:CspA family cold shock protein